MVKKLFLLDGMALAYRAHFALVARPIFTSKGLNTSAIFGFTQTLLDILKNQQPTHLAVAFDTDAPTQRHLDFPDYKATRQAMPEDLSSALPHLRRVIDAFRIPLLACDGFEADDIIGTLARRAEKQGFQTFMVTPDKDFGQLVDANTFLYKPGRMGSDIEILGLPEIKTRWGIDDPMQVIDVLALMGDASDNIPGVPGIGEKTAVKLIGQFRTVENLLANTGSLTGRVKENLEKFQDQARLSKKLATINCDAPCPEDVEHLKLQPLDEAALKALLVEFEFNSLGRRLFGNDFKAGRGFTPAPAPAPGPTIESQPELEPVPGTAEPVSATAPPAPGAPLKTLADIPHDYRVANTPQDRATLLERLQASASFAFHVPGSSADLRASRPRGIAFSTEPNRGWFVPLPDEPKEAAAVAGEFRSALESDAIEKCGFDLKRDLRLLRRLGIRVRGKLFDVLIAHSLVEPDMRHNLPYLAEALLGRTPSPSPAGTRETADQPELPSGDLATMAAERADLALQLRKALDPLLEAKVQARVFNEVEAPLVPVLVEMEQEGIRVDAAVLGEFSAQLAKEIAEHEGAIYALAGQQFNLNSPRQLGQILFEVMKIASPTKKTRTGQYSTDEQTLAALAPDQPIVQRLLEYRELSKLKSTYADALPTAIWPPTGRVHTTYYQVATATGRLNSQDPNLQNIPIRTERGQEIRKAFLPRNGDYVLLSADYSQIELRIIAALSREAGLLEAFSTNVDVHTATAARVYGVFLEMVTPEMRRKAKMVNYGIAYGISAFGLAQRLGIPRKEAAAIIDQYFHQFPGIRKYMDDTIAFARKNGFVETVTGRRRYFRDINSSNFSVRGAAERNAINAPIQGTAADMIKLAMIQIQSELTRRNLRTRMLLQVHDELVFDLHRDEQKEVMDLVEDKMKTALPLEVPIVVEMGTGENWLAAH
jgi:DNA polymerase-1